MDRRRSDLQGSPQTGLEEVAAAIRAELRLEAEEAERDAAVLAAMRRSLAEVAAELMAHGDTVALDTGERIFVGRIVGVGSDFVSLDTGTWQVDVAIPRLLRLRVLERPRSGGVRLPGSAASLRARLLELHLAGVPVEIGVTGTDEPVTGPIGLVGADHVAVGDERGPEWFVPLAALSFLRTRDPAAYGD